MSLLHQHAHIILSVTSFPVEMPLALPPNAYKNSRIPYIIYVNNEKIKFIIVII